MKKKKVLMIGPLDIQGGMSTVMKNYIHSKYFNEYIDLEYISTAKDGSIFEKLNKMLKGLIKFVYVLVFCKIDLIHIHTALDGSIYRKGIFINLAKFLNKKVVLHFHASDLDDFYYKRCNEIQRNVVRNIFNKADIIISLNKSIQNRIKEIFNLNSHVLYNFTNNCPNNIYNVDSKNILMISRLTKDKGVYEAINIMKDLKHYDIKLILAGDSQELDEIKNYVKCRELDDVVIFTGWVDDTKKFSLFEECFVSILPSHFEGIPMSILESLSCGVPIIASRVGGIPEIISNSEGYLHNSGDEEELKSHIINLYNDLEKRKSMSNNCIKKYERLFMERNHIEELNNIYKFILE